jgi:hypothetical protein
MAEKREKESREREQRVVIHQFQEMMRNYNYDREKLQVPKEKE